MGKLRILAIGSHPDDIELGCGGTLLKAARAGHEIFMYVLTRGNRSGSAEERTNELFQSATFVHAKTLWVDNFQDTDLAVGSRIINHIEYFIHRSDPDVILTHALNDYHHDHRAVAESTLEAARDSQNVLAYEIPVTKEFVPQLYYDVSDVIDDKVRLIGLFLSQRGKSFTLGSAVKGMAEYRALQSRLNSTVTHAEAFQVLKMCTNTNFGMIKFAKRSIPSAVLEGINGSLKDIIEFSPYAHVAEILKSADPRAGSIHAVAPSEILVHSGKKDELLASSTGAESLHNSLKYSNGIGDQPGVKEEDIIMEE